MPDSPPTATHHAVARSHVSAGVLLVIACLAQFMVVLDTTIVNVALPAMRTGLGLSTVDQQWVVDGYLITFGGLLLLAARAGDLFGRRRVFQWGLVIFTLASLAGGFADSAAVLLAARFVQGVGAAALAPASLSLITASFPVGPARTKALGVWSATAASAGAVGLVVGGLLTTLSWRWVLFVNVPLGVGLFAAAAWSLLPHTAADLKRRLDVPGALAVTVGVGGIVFGISEATIKGWGSATVIGALAAAVVLLALFLVIEMRTKQPLMPLRIFRYRSLSTANTVMLCLGIVMTSTIFFLSLYLQQAEGYSALKTGFAMAPLSVLLTVGSLVARRIIARTGARSMMIAGAVITTVGVAWISRLPLESSYVVHILLPSIVIGTGMSLTFLPVASVATTDLPARDAGLASGLVNMGRQIGGALGLAVLVTVAATSTSHSGLASHDAAVIHGYRLALLIVAAVSAASVLTALLIPRPGQKAVAAAAPASRQGDPAPSKGSA